MGADWSNTEVLANKKKKVTVFVKHLVVQNILNFRSTSKGLGHLDLDIVVWGLKKKSYTDSKRDYFQTKRNANAGNIYMF